MSYVDDANRRYHRSLISELTKGGPGFRNANHSTLVGPRISLSGVGKSGELRQAKFRNGNFSIPGQ